MMKKGVTPVVAVILLLLITVAIVGFAYGFFGRVFSTTATRTQNQTEELAGSVGSSFRIENAVGTSVVLRNTGSEQLDWTRLRFYINNAPNLTTISCTPAVVIIDGTTTCTLGVADSCTIGEFLRVAGPSAEDTVTCR